MNSVLFATLGAVTIGVSDAAARITARAFSASAVAMFVYALSSLALTAWYVALGAFPEPPTTLTGRDPWSLALISGIANAIAVTCVYASIARGPAALASPTLSSFSILLIALNALAGQPFTLLQMIAAGVVFLGVAQLSRPDRAVGAANDLQMETPAHLRITLALALAGAVAIALRMFWAQEATDEIGALATLWISRVAAMLFAGVMTLCALFWARRRASTGDRLRASPGVIGLLALQAALETIALALFLSAGGDGDGMGDRIGAAIGFSAFAAVTPIVTWLWFGDPLSRRRCLWIALVIVAGGVAAAGAPL